MEKRFRPSPAMVVACLALFVSIAGTAVAASYLVSSNSQVGPGTISGHHPPTGKHSNLITGSVNAQDLALGSVTGTRLAPASVSSSKLNLPRMSFSGSGGDPNDGAPHHTVLNLDGVNIGVTCTFTGPSTELQLYASSSSGGTLRGSFSTGLTGPATSNIANVLVSSTPTEFASDASTSTPKDLAGEFTYANANRVIGILVDGSANIVSDSCDMHGTAVPVPN
jgi:hypothetical protein